MGQQSLKGWARLVAAFRNSRSGFRDVWRGEEAFRIEFTLLVLSVPLAFWLAPDIFTAAILIGSLLLLVIVEVLNSAIEAVVDRIGPERHELSRIAKDLGSLAVLLTCLLTSIVWGAVLFQRFAI